MKNAVRVRRSRMLAFCFAALALIAVVWSAAATAREDEIPAGYTSIGNFLAHFSSDVVEVVTAEGEVVYTAPFDYAGRTLTPSGEGAAAWAPGEGMLLLGEGGYLRVEPAGKLLGVFGSVGGAVCAVCETRDGPAVTVYSGSAAVFSLECESFFPIACAVSPSGNELAVLSADGAGYALRIYSISGGSAAVERLDSAAADLSWTGDGPEISYVDGNGV